MKVVGFTVITHMTEKWSGVTQRKLNLPIRVQSKHTYFKAFAAKRCSSCNLIQTILLFQASGHGTFTAFFSLALLNQPVKNQQSNPQPWHPAVSGYLLQFSSWFGKRKESHVCSPDKSRFSRESSRFFKKLLPRASSTAVSTKLINPRIQSSEKNCAWGLSEF